MPTFDPNYIMICNAGKGSYNNIKSKASLSDLHSESWKLLATLDIANIHTPHSISVN